MALFILLIQDSNLAKSPPSIHMAQVQIRSLQSQLFMSLNPIMLKTFEIYWETVLTFLLPWYACVCACVHVLPPLDEMPYFIGEKNTEMF